MKNSERVEGAAVADLRWDVCNESTRRANGNPQYGTLGAHWGYSTAHDGERDEVHLGEGCFFNPLAYLKQERRTLDMFDADARSVEDELGVARPSYPAQVSGLGGPLSMNALADAINALRQARHIVVFTGAGISAESGIPTFRDRLTGLWAHHDPQRLETAKAFKENPPLVWGWYLWRRQQVLQARPNAAHLAITRLADGGRESTVITQNIDDLHERAGSQDVLHLHGSLTTPKCFACHRPAELTQEQLAIPAEGALIEPPRCARCNGRLRPGVVWFGEDLPAGAWKAATQAARSCDVMLSIGTSGVVMPATSLPDLALAAGAMVIHINPVDVSMDRASELMLIGQAGQMLPSLIKQASAH
jgi:NAD-dependent deacetylase